MTLNLCQCIIITTFMQLSTSITTTCEADKDCYLQCDASNACGDIYCPANANCIINATSPDILAHSTIYGGNDGNLTMYCDAQNSCDQTMIYCPIKGNCLLYAYKGRSNYLKSNIQAQNSSNLYIDVITVAALMSASIYCPITTMSGNQNNCIIKAVGDAGNGYRTLYSTKIYALESFTDLIYECSGFTEERPCSDNAQIFCDDGFTSTCIISPVSVAYDPITMWKCDDSFPSNTSKCIDLTFNPTNDPTGSPSMDPTTAPTSDPTVEPTSYPTAPTHSPTVKGICGLGKDCYVPCNALDPCPAAIYCPDDYSCVINATSQNILLNTVIYGGNNGNLTMYCDAQNSCDRTVINCPTNGNCLLFAMNGRSNYIKSDIQAQDSKYLYIAVTTVAALMSADIYCPFTKISGNQNNCVIKAVGDAGNGYRTLYSTKIYALESFTDLTYECYAFTEERPCSDNAQIFCDDGFTSSCIISPVSVASDPITEWKCIDSFPSNTSKCMDITFNPTNDPTKSPSVDPTTEPTSDPTMEPTAAPTAPTYAPTVKGICGLGKDCYVPCNALDPCPAAIYCPDDYSCVINATSQNILLNTVIYGGNNGNLTMYCDAQNSCDRTVINCPTNGNCLLFAMNGRSNYIRSNIQAQDAKYLYIDVMTVAALMSASIYCPITTMSGNQNNCIIKAVGDAGNGYRTLYSTKIYALESFTDLIYECSGFTEERPCSDNAQIFCDDGFTSSCIISPVSVISDPITMWKCDDSFPSNTSKCIDLTLSPTMNPITADPTVAPSSDPTVNPSASTTYNPVSDPTVAPTDAPTRMPLTTEPTVTENSTISGDPNVSDVKNITFVMMIVIFFSYYVLS